MKTNFSFRFIFAVQFLMLASTFGAQAQMDGHRVRTIGLKRATVRIGMLNLVYNMKRLVQLLKRDGKRLFLITDGISAPVVA